MFTCPRCNVPLTAAEQQEVRMEGCGQCGGRWLTAEGLRALIDAYEPDGEVGGPVPRKALNVRDAGAAFPCPACGAPMETFNYAGDSGVLLDRCHRCNALWLDGGELERVLRAAAASERGLDRDIKRFSGTLHQLEVREDDREQRDNRSTPEPLSTTLVNRILGD